MFINDIFVVVKAEGFTKTPGERLRLETFKKIVRNLLTSIAKYSKLY